MPGLHFDMMERCDTGPRVREADFDNAIFPKVTELAEKYEIKYDPEHVVASDDDLADRLFAAGMEMAVFQGLWVLDTQKVVKFSEPEIWRYLENYHTHQVLGYGKDQVILEPRKPESDVKALVFGGGAGSSMTEGEVYTKHMMNFALEPTVDLIANGNPAYIEGREIRPFSPLETHGAIQEVGWIREAIRRAGRPGMPIVAAPGCAASAPPAVAIINEERGLRKGDFIYAALLTELKSDYDRLIRAVAAVEQGINVCTLLAPMIGGWAGGPEGAAICGVAATLLAAICHTSTLVVHHPVHMSLKNGATTHRQTLWVESVVGQAVSLNSTFPIGQNIFLDARAGTYEILWEGAANAITAVSSGQHVGPGPSGVTGGDDIDMISGVEMRIIGETTRAVTGMDRKTSNEIVKKCLAKYEPTLGKPPKGKTMQELYDFEKLTPKEEWLSMFEEVKAELKDWGVPFKY
ncbi:MAG: monomethylamine:corrinoid methyltransferase [Desulfobacterales bacterium]|jgi:methylamine--corrinoid protein Co-methyltransferase